MTLTLQGTVMPILRWNRILALKPVCLFIYFLSASTVSKTNLSFTAKLIICRVRTKILLKVNVDFEILCMSFCFYL